MAHATRSIRIDNDLYVLLDEVAAGGTINDALRQLLGMPARRRRDLPLPRAIMAALTDYPGASVADLSLETGISKATIYVVLSTLEETGHVTRTSGQFISGKGRAPDQWHAGSDGVGESGDKA